LVASEGVLLSRRILREATSRIFLHTLSRFAVGTKRQAMFSHLQMVVESGVKTGVLREQPIFFLGGVIQALADMVLEMASRDPAKGGQYKRLGWEALWSAIARHDA
jgi:hypothetical protein